MLNEFFNIEEDGVVESVLDMEDADIMTDALEAEIFLLALREECRDDAEFDSIVTECATELELMGLIPNAEIVTEARKNIVKLNKAATLASIEKRTAIRMAEKDNSQLYKLYAKARKLLLDAREKIYAKYGSKAKTVAKKIVANSRRKASAMNSDTGSQIREKMDRVIEKNK